MIKLSQVSSKELIKMGIKDYSELEKKIYESKGNDQIRNFTTEYVDVLSNLERVNSTDPKPDIHYLEIDKRYDSQVSVLDLPRNPYYPGLKEFLQFEGMSVYELELLITHCDSFGHNLLEGVRGDGKSKCLRMKELLLFYQEQRKRSPRGFYAHQDEKREIVEKDYYKIVRYLNYERNSGYIWDFNRETYERTRAQSASREIMTNVITNYTTLSELSKDYIGNGTLKRFIRK